MAEALGHRLVNRVMVLLVHPAMVLSVRLVTAHSVHLATDLSVAPDEAPSVVRDMDHLDAAVAEGVVAQLALDPALHKIGQHSVKT
jgi:hypothetical protein